MGKRLKIETAKRREKWNIFSSGNTISNSVLSGSRMEIFSDEQLILEGCLGILEYNENYLKLRISKGAIVIEGTDFDMVSFEEKTMVLNGKFMKIEFVV